MVRDRALSAGAVQFTGAQSPIAVAAKAVKFDLVLAPASPAALQRFVYEVSSPRSSLYHHYLTEREFVRRFGPRRAVVGEAADWLRADGFTVTGDSGFVVSVTGPTSALQRLGYSVRPQLGPVDGAQVHGPRGLLVEGSPLVPVGLVGRLSAIVGLGDVARPRVMAARPVRAGHGRSRLLGGGARGAAAPGGPGQDGPTPGRPTPGGSRAKTATAPPTAQVASQPAACSAASNAAQQAGALTVDQVASHYDFTMIEALGQYGSGTTVALAEVDPLSTGDVQAYEACFGLSNQPTVVKVDGGPSPTFLGEADLDFEEVATMAPGATVDVYEAPATLSGILDSLNQIVSADKAQVVSMSLGVCEGPGDANVSGYETGMNTVLEEAAAQGQSVLAASGDDGSEGCFDGTAQAPSTSLSVDFPSSSPLVTAVGGTVLTDNGELAWNDCNGAGSIQCAEQISAQGGVGASGGGVSTVYHPGPTGQPVLKGSGGYRELPDVSAESGSNMGDFVEYYIGGSWQPYLGTSVATPIWASLVADRDAGCSAPSGDFNPALYAVYNAGGSYGTAFNLVDQGYPAQGGFTGGAGNNDYTQTNGGSYALGAGYNMVSGLGSPVATGLACPQVTGTYSARAGQQVTLTGVGLEGATIDFGSTAAHIVSESGTTATVVVPSGQGTVHLSASSGILGSSQKSATFTYTTGTGGTTTTSPTTTTTNGQVTTEGGGGPGSQTTTTTGNIASPVTSTTRSPVPTSTVPATSPGHRGGHGYWLVGQHGQVYSFGLGRSATSPHVPASTTVAAIAPTPDDKGYWLVSTTGQVFSAGDAHFYGDLSGLAAGVPGAGATRQLANPVIGIVPSPDGRGYLLVGANGEVLTFGDAQSAGTCALHGGCSGTVVSAVSGPTGGYWLVTASGRVYAYGGARPVGQCSPEVEAGHSAAVDAAATPDGRGLWVLLADATVCHTGDAGSYRPAVSNGAEGSPGASASAAKVTATAIVPAYGAAGYWVVTTTGSVLRFGDAPAVGDASGDHLDAPLVAAAGW